LCISVRVLSWEVHGGLTVCTDAMARTKSVSTGRERGGDTEGNARLAVPLILAAVFATPGVLTAQENSPSAGDVRKAGNEARFRVIERLPNAGGDREGSSPALEYAVSEDVRAGMRREEWSAALEALRGRIGEWEPRLRFLRAVLRYRLEEYERAYEEFARLRSELPPLADYSAYLAGASALELGRHHDAVLAAAKVPESSRLYSEGLYVLAKGLIGSGADSDWRRAERVIRRYLARFGEGAHAAELRLAAVEELLDREQWESAAERLFEIRRYHPLAPEAERARELLDEHRDEWSESARSAVDEPPDRQRTAYFRALFERHRSERLIEELGEEVDRWTPGSRERCRAAYWMGKSHTKLRRHGEAAEWYDRILEDCRGVGPYERRALYLGGKSYWNTGDLGRALELFDRLSSGFSDHSFADDALYFSARILREQGRPERAVSRLREQVERYPEGDMASDAHWLLVRRWLEVDRFGEIVSYVEGLERTGEREAETRGRLRYFLGRAHQKRGDAEAARSAYRRVVSSNPLDYYALLAANRLARMAGAAEGTNLCGEPRPDFCEEFGGGAEGGSFGGGELPAAVRSSRAFERGSVLLSVGLREWAGEEFRRLLDRVETDPKTTLAVAHLLDRAGAYSLSYSIPSRVDGWRARYPAEGYRRPWTISFPRAFREEVEKWSERREVSSALVHALIRKESGFEPGVESWANARGLMQLMWETAEGVAGREGISTLSKSRLFEPDFNLRLGTAYLAGLLDRFGGHPVLAAAGYNGGRGNVVGWLDNRPSLPLDLWVEAIPYGQTRRYAKRAAAYFWAYRWLYEGGEVPRVAFDLSAARGGGASPGRAGE